VSDEILVPHPGLPNDHLGIEHDEAAEDSESDVDMELEKKLRPEKDVEEAEEEEGVEAREEGSTKVEVFTIRGKKGSSCEGGKDRGGEHESRGDNGRVEPDGHAHQGSQPQACQEGKTKEHSHPHAAVLSVVRGHEEAEGEAKPQQGKEEASTLEKAGVKVNVSPCCGSHDRHGEAGVDILEMRPHRGLELRVEAVEKVVNGCSHNVRQQLIFWKLL